MHRAPHPRASTASSNPAERSAAEIRRESHRPRAARRVVRATLGFDIQLASIQLARVRLVRPDRPSARVTSRSRTRAASACFLSRDVADTCLTDERLLDRRCARADDSRGSQPPPPRVEFAQSSSRRVELDARRARDSRHLRTIRESRSRTRVSPERNRARDPPDERHALTHLPHSHTPHSEADQVPERQIERKFSANLLVSPAMRAMVGVDARIAHRRRRHRTRASFRLGPWVVLAVLVSLVVPGAFAAPFADRTALKAAVDSCITLDPTGVACCSHGADCGAAGPVEMPDWGRVAGDGHEKLVRWQGAVQRGYIAVGRQLGHEHVRDVPLHLRVQQRYRYMGHLERHDHGEHVPGGRRVQPAPIEMGRQLGHDHEPDVLRCQPVQRGYRCMGYLERHGHAADVRPCHGVQRGHIEMGRQLGNEHVPDVLRRPRSSTRDIGAWDTSRVTTMAQDAHATPARSISTYRDGTSARSRPCTRMFCGEPTQFNTMPVGWDTSKVTDTTNIFTAATAWPCEVRGRRRRTRSRQRLDAQRRRVRRVSSAPSTAPSAPAPTPS